MTQQRRGMPIELMNELFSSMLLENAFGLLTKMPNVLLAKNVQKMINSIKEAMKSNKFNEVNCDPKLTISEDGLEAKYSAANTVRAVLSIPAFNFKANTKPIIYYFEMEIQDWDSINKIGFCDEQFPLEGRILGWKNYFNSFGFGSKYGIMIDGFSIDLSDGYFEKWDIVGFGIIRHPNSKMECFGTCDGQFLGKAELPTKYANIELFPAITLCHNGNSIHVNFGKNKWHFKEFELVLG